MPGVAGTLRGLYGASVPGTLGFDPIWAVSGLGITFLGAGAASAAAMIRTARMPLLAPAQPRAWAQASDRAMRLQALAALGLFLLGGLVGWLGSGLVAGFALLAGVLLGAALALPLLLSLGWRPCARWSPVPSPNGCWPTRGSSFRRCPCRSWRSCSRCRRISASPRWWGRSAPPSPAGWTSASPPSFTSSPPMTAEATRLATYLDGRADALLPILSAEARMFERPAEVFGIVDHSTYREAWPLLSAIDDPWRALFAGDGRVW
jgi:putative ABC transport system permease protein